MVKVFTGCMDCACINATTVEESTPPDRNAPSGTSAIIWPATELRNRLSSSSAASLSLPRKGLRVASVTVCDNDQYGRDLGRDCALISSAVMDNTVPGSSFEMPK